MKKFLLGSLLVITSQLYAQTDSVSKNHYSFSLINGLSFTKADPSPGSVEMKKAVCLSHGFNFQYTRNFTQHFSMSGIAGFGVLPFIFKTIAKDSASGKEPFGYFDRVSYTAYSNFALHANYRNKFSSKYAYQFHVGLGIKNFPVSYFEYGSFNQDTGVTYHYNGQFYGRSTAYITAGASIIQTLRNRDEAGIRLSYEQSFRNIYGGEYQLYSNSTGRFYNSGSNLNLALTYTFTGAARKEKLDRLKETDFPDGKSARKQYRKEIRYIDPKSNFITVSIGPGFGINSAKDGGDQISKSAAFASLLPRITFEKGIAKHYFAEAGFHAMGYWDVLKMKQYGIATGSNAVYSYQLSIGGGKRLITRNNYNIITFHAGLAFGYTNISKGFQGSYFSYLNSIDDAGQETFLLQVSGEEYGLHRFITSAYLGASKDFRITKRLYLALSYRYQQGFYTIFEQKVQYTTYQHPEVQSATIKINGSSHAFEFGVKVKL